MSETTKVAVGQVWADMDKRAVGRQVRVLSVVPGETWSGGLTAGVEGFALVELVSQRGRPARGHEATQRAGPGRLTRIRLDRFREGSTGYRLVAP